MLLCLGLLDELGVGVPISGAGLLQADLQVSASALTLALFTVPMAIALFAEPPLLLWASKLPRPRVLSLALLTIAASAGLVALSASYLGLMVGLVLWYPASGLAAGLGQAELMDRQPDAREQNLSRWTLLSELGDLGAPLLLAASLRLGLGYRGALLGAALLFALCGARAWFLPDAAAQGCQEEDEERATKSLREILRNRPLLAWLGGAALCDLLDETLAALAALRIEQHFGSDAFALGLLLSAFCAGGLAGLGLGDRWLTQRDPRHVLATACGISALALLAFVAVDSLYAMALCLALLGAASALHYPLVQAQAYRAAPHDSAWVATLSSAFTVVSLLSTPALGWLVDHAGLSWALLALLAQPLGLLLLLYMLRPS